MIFYPTHRILLEDTRIVRKHTLPSGVIGDVLVEMSDTVAPNQLLVSGTRPSDYRIIDIAAPLKIDPENEEKIKKVLAVEVGQEIEAGTKLVNVRRSRLVAPDDARVLLIEQGLVILQVTPEVIEVHAGFRGIVTAIEPRRGVTVEAQGTLLQCAWGNGQYSIAGYEFEPGTRFSGIKSDKTGLEDLMNDDLTLSPYRGKVVILMRPLREIDFEVVKNQELAGIVAPSAPVNLRKKAMQLKVPVILTEGFGNMPATMRLYELLLEKRGNQAVFDATAPDSRHNTRPEMIIPVGMARQEKQRPKTTTPLSVGMLVHVRRAPHMGRLGEITGLPELPMKIENGLRVLCAQVKLQTGERVIVPLANLDAVGI